MKFLKRLIEAFKGHDHNYGPYRTYRNILFKQCTHPGCRSLMPMPDTEKSAAVRSLFVHVSTHHLLKDEYSMRESVKILEQFIDSDKSNLLRMFPNERVEEIFQEALNDACNPIER